MINRSAVIVRPKDPYIEWAKNLDDSGILPESQGERTVYLIPEYEDDVEAMSVLGACYDFVFQAELEGWCTDESTWPKNRTFKMFREWFNFEFHSVVEDICGYEIADDYPA